MINQFNENRQPHGYWESYFSNGKVETKGYYINGLKDGYWEDYWTNGQLYTIGYFKKGELDGYWEFYGYDNFQLTEKEFYII